MRNVLEGSEGAWSLMGSLGPVKVHIGREWHWTGAMRRRMNSLTTIGAVTPTFFNLASLGQTWASRRSMNSECP